MKDRIELGMIFNLPEEITKSQKMEVLRMVDEFMNTIADTFGWEEEEFSFEKLPIGD